MIQQPEKFITEIPSNQNFVKAINTIREYPDKRRFPIDEIVVADKPVNPNATNPDEVGGVYFSTYNKVLRWILRGDTLCDVIVPEGEKVYELLNKNNCPHGVFVAGKIILTNPRPIDDDLVFDLYVKSELPWKSYFQILTIIALRGFEKSSRRIVADLVTKENKDEALKIYKEFLDLKEEEKTGLYNDVMEWIKTGG